MSRGYEHLSHTADVKIRAWGADLTEAFIEGCRGFTAVLVDPATLTATDSRSINLVAVTKDALLYDLLSEAIYFHDIDGFLPLDGMLKLRHTANHWALSGTIRGAIRKGEAAHGDVKAMTYHDLLIEETPHKAIVTFVVDV